MSAITDFVKFANECAKDSMKLADCIKYFSASNFSDNWCAWFVSECGKKAGMTFAYNTSASAIQGVNGNKKLKDAKPKVGDIVRISPSNGTTVSHVGIITAVDSKGNISTIEGNMSGGGDYNKSYVRSTASFPYPPDGVSKNGFGTILEIGVN